MSVRLLRQDHWQRRLVEWSEQKVGREYAIGVTDCATLALEAIAVLCSSAPAPSAPSTVSTLRELVEWVKAEQDSHGSVGGGFEARGLVAAGGMTYAQPGDVVVWEATDEVPLPMIGVVVGAHLMLSSDVDGVELQMLQSLHGDQTAALYRVPG